MTVSPMSRRVGGAGQGAAAGGRAEGGHVGAADHDQAQPPAVRRGHLGPTRALPRDRHRCGTKEMMQPLSDLPTSHLFGCADNSGKIARDEVRYSPHGAARFRAPHQCQHSGLNWFGVRGRAPCSSTRRSTSSGSGCAFLSRVVALRSVAIPIATC